MKAPPDVNIVKMEKSLVKILVRVVRLSANFFILLGQHYTQLVTKNVKNGFQL